MKKASLILIALTFIFAAFTGGFLLGRNFNHNEVNVSVLHQAESTIPDQTNGSTPADDKTPLLVDVNTATVEQLVSLPGIGEVLAQRIIDYRQENGPFQSIAQLCLVEGIGDKKLESILEYITIGGHP